MEDSGSVGVVVGVGWSEPPTRPYRCFFSPETFTYGCANCGLIGGNKNYGRCRCGMVRITDHVVSRSYHRKWCRNSSVWHLIEFVARLLPRVGVAEGFHGEARRRSRISATHIVGPPGLTLVRVGTHPGYTYNFKALVVIKPW